MTFDIVLPSIVSIVAITTVLLYAKFETKLKSLFEEKEFRVRDSIFLVVAMSFMVTVIVFVPQEAIKVLFLVAYFFVLFLFTYVAVEKWYLAVLPPIAFVALYLFFWDLILLNIFAILFAVFVSVYLGGLFSWTTVLIFAGLITVMDVVQVFVTGYMGEAATKLIGLRLPVLVYVTTFPRDGWIGLGLGDIFLAGLLSIQTMLRFDRKTGVISALSMGIAFFIYETIVFHFEFFGFFPATIVVLCGWLLGLGIHRLVGERGS
ncbi:MAG: hypothetical protein ACLFU9_01915 [Candidatus Bathyarchaeia archaeon]